jgi:hypothetical protein
MYTNNYRQDIKIYGGKLLDCKASFFVTCGYISKVDENVTCPHKNIDN